jgi:hypothetical protein
MKKALQISMMVFMLLCASVNGAIAQSPKLVTIPAGFKNGEHFYIVRGQDIPVIGNSYIASSQNLVKEFINSVSFNVTVMDAEENVVMRLTPETVRQLWSQPNLEVSGYLYFSTKLMRSSFSQSHWSITLPDLADGSYELHTKVELTKELSRGCDLNGDGLEDIYLPEDYNHEFVVYVHIYSPGQ